MNAANATLHASALENERRAHEPSMEEILASIRKIIADDEEPSSRPMAEARRALAPTRRPFETNVTPLAPPPSPESARDPDPAPAVAPEAEVAPEAVQAPEPAPAPEAAPEPVQAAEESPFVPTAPPVEDELPPQPVAVAPEPVVAAPPALDAADLASFHEIAQELAADDESQAQPPAEEDRIDTPAPDQRPILAKAADFGRSSSFDLGTSLAPQAFDGDMGAMLSAEANASISSAFQALSASVQMTSAETIERHVRELLRPMLKQWLDDNLPVMVERMVRAEIERVARGGR